MIFLKDEPFEIPKDLNFLNKIGQNICNCLLNSQKYQVHSDVQPHNFRLFYKYLTSDNYQLEVNSDNYSDFYLLNDEFNNIISDILSSPEFDSVRKESILNLLLSREKEDKSQIEKDIAADLDFYLDRYKEKMSQVPETSLYNIFNHESRKLNNHNAAYQFIIENINKNNENKRSFCILIATLDALKMNEKLIQESNLHREEHFGFVPKSSDSFICSLNKIITEMKNQIDTKFEQLFSLFLNQQQKIDEKFSSIEGKYEQLSNKIIEIQSSIQKVEESNNDEDVKGSVQRIEDKVDSIQSSIQQVSRNVEIINECTQLHFIFEKPFNGIIHKLTEECGGNVHTKGIVNVTSSPTSINHGFDREAKYAVDFNDDENYFCSQNAPSSWLKYDFKSRKIRPTHYSIKSSKYFGKGKCNLINWVIEGSNNDYDWIELDKRNDVHDIDGLSLVQTFRIQKILKPDEYYQYVRIRSTGLDSTGEHYFILFSALEYFGSII